MSLGFPGQVGRVVTAGSGVGVDRTPAGVALRLVPEAAARPVPGFWAVIMPGTPGHHWRQTLFDHTGAPITPTHGLTSASTGILAAEVNGRTAVPPGTAVYIHALISIPDEAGAFRRLFLFDLGAGATVDETGDALEPLTLQGAGDTDEPPHGDDWDIQAQDEKRGVVLPMLTRVVYDPAGDQVIYGYTRMLSFDANGHLVGVSDEARHEVHTPEDCP